MKEASILEIETLTCNLARIEEQFKFWNYIKSLELAEFLIEELKIYTNIAKIYTKALKLKQFSLIEIHFWENRRKIDEYGDLKMISYKI